MSDPTRDPVPPTARAVIDLFRSALDEVRFPDVDRATLDGDERALLDAQCALEDAEAALERARAEVAERTSALQSRAQRALAYARVFAEGDPELRGRVEAIPTASGGAPKREKQLADAAVAPKRTRKKKGDDDAAPLFGEAATDAGSDAASIEAGAVELAS